MFDRDMLNPNPQTHVPVMVEIPSVDEAKDNLGGRAPIQPPTLWMRGVECVHKVTGRIAAVMSVDLGTMQFRPYFPDTNEHGDRTHWESCQMWIPRVTVHPEEAKRREVQKALEAEIDALDPEEIEDVRVMLDGDDPVKALAKLNAMKRRGFIKGRPAALAQAAEPKVKPAKKKDGGES